jgi:phage tail sheath gpL-like
VTVALLNTLYSYTAAEGDTAEDFVINLAESIDNDPNISATADLSQLAVNLALSGVPYSVSLSSGSLSLFSPDSGQLPASIIFTGTPQSGQTVTVNIGSRTYNHSTTATDSIESILTALAGLINANTNDARVLATASAATKSLTLESTVTLSIPYRVYFSPGPGLTVVETAPPETGIRVPGDIVFHGIPVPGEEITVFLANVSYSYVVAPGDTMASVLENLAGRISQDVNVSATVDLSRNAIQLQLKNSEVVVRFFTRVSRAGILTADPIGGALAVDGQSAANITFSGAPEPGQEARVAVANRLYSYTVQPGDSAEAVVSSLAALVDADPIAAATADLSIPAVHLTVAPLSVSSAEKVPGAVTIGSAPAPGHSVTVKVQASSYTYTAVEGDTLESFTAALAERINADANVRATADPASGRIQIELQDPSRNLELTLSASAGAVHYAAAVSSLPGFVASPAYERFKPKTGNVSNTVSLALGERAFLVPGSVLIGGTPEPGQTITVKLAETVYTYTTVPGDTLQSIVNNLAAVVNTDPNVSATANLSILGVDLALKNPQQDPAPVIGFSASVSVGSTVTVFVSGRVPTNTVNVAVVSAQMVRDSIGLYSVTFTLPLDLPTNPETILEISQNLIVFGSVTQFNITSNPVTFAVIAP